MEKEDAANKDRTTRRVASVVTTSALSLTLFSCLSDQGQVIPGTGQPSKPAYGQGGATFSDRQAYDKYFAVGYDYIDAKVLASFWGENSPSDAKLRMGRKMLTFGPQEGRPHLRDARSAATRGDFWYWPVSYVDGGYSFNDAARVGAYWGGDVVHGKMKLARNLIQGHDDWNRAALAAAF